MHRLFIDQNVRLEVAAALRADEAALRWATEIRASHGQTA